MNKIVYIAPESKTQKLVEETARNLGINVKIRIAKGRQRFQVAREEHGNGAEIAVSRWGFGYPKAQRELEISVINVLITAYDVVRTIHNIKTSYPRYNKLKFGIIHEGMVIEKFLKMACYHDISFHHTIAIQDVTEKTMEKALDEMEKKSVDVIIGGLDVIENNVYYNSMEGVRIETGSEGISNGLIQAQAMVFEKLREREKTNELKAIFESAHEGIIVLDKHNCVTIFNREASRIFNIPSERATGKPIDSLCREFEPFCLAMSEERVVENLQKIEGRHIILNHVPVYSNSQKTGTIITLVDSQRIVSIEAKLRKEFSKKGLEAQYHFHHIESRSPMMALAIEEAKKYALVNSSILIQGETGTGKELFAQSIHNVSDRKDGPFVGINCATIPRSILESELFGYVGGAFSGAKKEGKPGVFELAHNGTIFLDEIGEIPLDIQPSFLRVLEEKKVFRLGSDAMIPINIRVVAATNRDLMLYCSENKFRTDLYYRLSTLILDLPPLRQRKEDILLLLDLFLKEYQKRMGKKCPPLSRDMEEILLQYPWPGNVRELRNVAERYVAITDEHTPLDLKQFGRILQYRQEAKVEAETELQTLSSLEMSSIQKALALFEGNKKKAAQYLGISYTTLWRRLKKNNNEE